MNCDYKVPEPALWLIIAFSSILGGLMIMLAMLAYYVYHVIASLVSVHSMDIFLLLSYAGVSGFPRVYDIHYTPSFDIYLSRTLLFHSAP
jgi:hypothetical protein